MPARVQRKHLVTAAILVGLLVVVGLLVAAKEPERCPDGTLHTGFSCPTGTSVETPSHVRGWSGIAVDSRVRENWTRAINRQNPGGHWGWWHRLSNGQRRTISRAAAEGGAHEFEVRPYTFGGGKVAVAVRLQVDHVGRYLQHRVMRFVKEALEGRYFLVEVYDEEGRSAWHYGTHENGGIVGTRRDLEGCNPITRGHAVGRSSNGSLSPPPCPADRGSSSIGS